MRQPVSPSPVVSNTLSLTSTKQELKSGQTGTLKVTIESQGVTNDDTKLIQVELSYDPRVLTGVSLSPGDYFQHPTVMLNLVDTKTGRISYAIESADKTPHGTTGTVAEITFTVNPAFSGKETNIFFLPKTVIRSAEGKNMLTATYGTKLLFVNKNAKQGL